MKNTKVFTPEWMVREMLRFACYMPYGDIYRRHFIDNSCGDGAILRQAVITYCRSHKGTKDELRGELGTYFHGIEIDPDLCNRARKNLSDVASEFGVTDVNWDIVCGDAMSIRKYDGLMDYVVGNPPYMKVHDFGDMRSAIKERRFTSKGMQDLYVAFFDVGTCMLSESGRMAYITPSTWFSSVYGRELREYLSENNLIDAVCSCMGGKVFEDADTYPAITVLDKRRGPNSPVTLYLLNGRTFDYYTSRALDFFICDGKFLFNGGDITLAKKVNETQNKTFKVKNGFATLKDSVFVVTDNMLGCVDTHVIPCIKATKGFKRNIIFPYDRDGRPVKYEDLGDKTKHWMVERATLYGHSTQEDGWWLYGRTQAICDVYKNKYTVPNVITPDKCLNIMHAPPGTGVYGGLYVTCDDDELLDRAMDDVKCDKRFLEYLITLGHYKNGGYYTFSSKEFEKYLNWKHGEDMVHG